MVVSNIFYFHPYLEKITILTNIFQMGWNHQLDMLPTIMVQWKLGEPPSLSRAKPWESPSKVLVAPRFLGSKGGWEEAKKAQDQVPRMVNAIWSIWFNQSSEWKFRVQLLHVTVMNHQDSWVHTRHQKEKDIDGFLHLWFSFYDFWAWKKTLHFLVFGSLAFTLTPRKDSALK